MPLNDSNVIFGSFRWHRVPVQNSSLARSAPFLARLCVDPALVNKTGAYYSIDTQRDVSTVANIVSNQEALVAESRALIKRNGY